MMIVFNIIFFFMHYIFLIKLGFNMKKFSLIFVLVFLAVGLAMAQRTITGTITDSDGEALIGATVVAKGTSVGTVTDFDGKYILEFPKDATELEVSYTGYAAKTIVVGGATVIDVELLSAANLLDEIVVSATGLERNARNVTYSNQTVGSEDLLSAPNKNTLEALRGKVAGVKLSTGSGSVGASTRIVLRGEGSLTGNNNALIVVDGVVIDNSTSAGGDSNQNSAGSNGYADYGNRFNDINPEDIESVTVLKGPSATSLYGSRGASGVLVITTKKGQASQGRMKVGVSSSTSLERAYVLLQRQDQYGQGFGLPFAAVPGFDSGENWSWGPAFDGRVRPWTSPVDADGDGNLEYLSRPYSAVKDQLQNFFRTGATYQNGINLSGGTDKLTYYTSFSNTTQDGILENTDYQRNTVKFAATAKLNERISSSFSVSYANVDQNSAQEGSRPFEGQNAYANAVQAPVNIPYNELRNYNSPFHDFNGYYGSYTVNPYYVLNEYVNNGKVNNVLGNFATTVKIIDGLSVTGRVGANIVSTKISTATPQYQYADHYVWADDLITSFRGDRQGTAGFFRQDEGNNVNLDVTALVNYERNLTSNGDFTMGLTGGWNLFNQKERTLTGQTVGGIVVPEFYSLSNSVSTPLASQTNFEKQINGLYGNAQFGYKNRVFLEYSARNDWSSTLPVGNNGFFYQSVGASAVLTDFFAESENIEFLKVRASIGTTGKDAPAYAINSTYVGNPILQSLPNNHDLTFPLNGQAGYTLGDRIGNPDLKPELTTTYELGLDATLFKERINIAYTYYNSTHTNQLVIVSLPSSSGFRSTVKNLGEIRNAGHELAVTLSPLKGLKRGLNWDINLLYATNKNEVIEILDPAVKDEQLVLGSFGNLTVVALEGQPYGTFFGVQTKTTPDGRPIVGSDGLPVLTDDPVVSGSYQPDFTASIGSDLTYKGFRFNFLFDFKEGGKFLSYTKDLTEFNGTSLSSLENRGVPFVIPNSVQEVNGEYVENTKTTNTYDYLRVQPFTSHLIDASYVKLREVGLSYTFPRSVTSKLPIDALTIGLFAKNVKFWLPDENVWADPEINGPALTGNAQGIETTQTPPSKSFGVNINLQF
jgi:TonB-linked SusC/RagA family outer membrane protein